MNTHSADSADSASRSAIVMTEPSDAERHQRLENALRDSEAQLSAIFSQAAVGLAEISLDGHFLRVNDELCRILGRTREEIVGLPTSAITHPDDQEASNRNFAHLVKTGKAVSLDKRLVQPDGTAV